MIWAKQMPISWRTRYALIEINRSEQDPGSGKIPDSIILKYNEKALEKEKHPRDVYKEPSALIVICANATMAYTTESESSTASWSV